MGYRLPRLVYIIIAPIRRVYWFLTRPKTRGAKCMLECDGKFLMIRNTYGHKRWTFPGGGIDHGETPEEAACREIKEEVGIIIEHPKFLGSFFHTPEYKRDTVWCYYKKVNSLDFKIDPFEIAEAKWFPIKNLPPHSPAANKTLELYRAGA